MLSHFARRLRDTTSIFHILPRELNVTLPTNTYAILAIFSYKIKFSLRYVVYSFSFFSSSKLLRFSSAIFLRELYGSRWQTASERVCSNEKQRRIYLNQRERIFHGQILSRGTYTRVE